MSLKLHWIVAIAVVVITACGGKVVPPGPSDSGPPTPSATATLTSPSDGKVEWNRATPLQLSLKDASGNLVDHPSCSSTDAVGLIVSADCSSATGHRIGSFKVTVSGGGVNADADVKVIPQRVVIGTNQSSSNGSGDFNAVVTSNGRVLVWGANVAGALGQGQSQSALSYKALPVAVKNTDGTGELSGIVAASAGTRTMLALNEDGEVFIWGGGAPLSFTTENEIYLPAKMPNAANNGVLNHIAAVSAGDENCIALADDGTVYAWGNYAGQGGTGADEARYPAQVKDSSGTGILKDIVGVVAGWNGSFALTSDGRIAAWGFTSTDTLGVSSSQGLVLALPTFIKNAGDGSDLSNMVSLSAGFTFALALGSDGKVYAWGENGSGQLGQGPNDKNMHLQAVVVKDAEGTGELADIVSINVGSFHALALGTDGKVFSWGEEQSGQLGDGSNHPRINTGSLPAPVVGTNSLGQLTDMVAIGTGYNHSMALASDGTLLIWGEGFGGDLGQGAATSFPDSYVPVAVKDPSGTKNLSLAPLPGSLDLYRRYR